MQDNLTVVKLKDLPWLLKSDREEAQITDHYINALSIATRGGQQIVGRLSGGNQQKVFLARWLNTDAEILLLDNPTQGIDVGAKSEIYTLMNNLVKQGKSIIMISSELPELLSMSDRLLLLANGKSLGVVSAGQYTEDEIMKLVTGAHTLKNIREG